MPINQIKISSVFDLLIQCCISCAASYILKENPNVEI